MSRDEKKAQPSSDSLPSANRSRPFDLNQAQVVDLIRRNLTFLHEEAQNASESYTHDHAAAVRDDNTPAAMTLSDYLNADRFPLTSRPAYSPKEQFFMDAFNLDQLEEGIADGAELNEKQRAAYEELKTKQPQMTRLTGLLRS